MTLAESTRSRNRQKRSATRAVLAHHLDRVLLLRLAVFAAYVVLLILLA